MRFGSTPERSMVAFITVPASSCGSMSASAPANVPMADRAAAKTTTSRLLMTVLLQWDGGFKAEVWAECRRFAKTARVPAGRYCNRLFMDQPGDADD
jgi:hypothetical protein